MKKSIGRNTRRLRLISLAAIAFLPAAGSFKSLPAAEPVVSAVQAKIIDISDNGRGMKTRTFRVTFDLADDDGDDCRIWAGVRGVELDPVLEGEGPYLFYKNLAGDLEVSPGIGHTITFTVTDTAGEFDQVRVKVTAWDREGWPPWPNQPFNPRHHHWAMDVRKGEISSRSSNYINHISGQESQEDWFLSVMVEFPVFRVMGDHPKETPSIDGYPSESDIVPMPFPHTSLGDPADAYAEGFPNTGNGDRHVEVVDVENWVYWTTYSSSKVDDPQDWRAMCEAYFDFKAESYEYSQNRSPYGAPSRAMSYRPIGWTSSDASGLSVTPGCILLHEIEEGEIHHALRTTVDRSYNDYVFPGSHRAGSSNQEAAPMGLRIRLKSSYDIDSEAPQQGDPGTDLYKASRASRIILRALQKYGMIVTDNAGSNWNSYLMAERDDHTQLKWADLWGEDYMSDSAPMDASITHNFFALTSNGIVTLDWNDFEIVDWDWQIEQYDAYEALK
ncbi:hypothetical protein ACFL5V_00730 [Fibrobacterota bacterium]